MKKFWNDFKEFISRGNVVDLAVAVVVGGAFGKIVTSLVSNIIMPLISLATGGVSIEDWKWVIKPADAVSGTAETALSYGIFIQSIIDFLIISFFIFLTIKLIQNSRKNIDKLATDIKKKSKRQKAVATESAENVEVSVVEKNEETKEINNDDVQTKLLEEIRDLLKSNK